MPLNVFTCCSRRAGRKGAHSFVVPWSTTTNLNTTVSLKNQAPVWNCSRAQIPRVALMWQFAQRRVFNLLLKFLEKFLSRKTTSKLFIKASCWLISRFFIQMHAPRRSLVFWRWRRAKTLQCSLLWRSSYFAHFEFMWNIYSLKFFPCRVFCRLYHVHKLNPVICVCIFEAQSLPM